MPATKIIALVAAVAVIVTGGAALAIARPVPSTPSAAMSYSKLKVTGYVEAWTTSPAALAKKSAKLTSVGIDGINFTPDGSEITEVTDEVYALLRQAHKTKDRAELLVGNFDDELAEFSPSMAANLLSSESNIQSTTTALAAEVSSGGWDGMQVDLESLESIVADDAGYTDDVTRFMQVLRSKLAPKKTLSMAIMATTGNYRDLGYDPGALAKSTDSIVLMAYDQHGPWEKPAGAVGGMPWVKKVLAQLLKSVDRSEVQLGIAGYGYSWPKKGEGKQYSAAAARALVKKDHAKVHWSGSQKERYATLRNGTKLWWSDAKSVDARVKLAKKLGLGGVAVWSVGLADTLD